MFFSDLREQYNPVIQTMFQTKTEGEIRSIMKNILRPFLVKVSGLIPESVVTKFNEGSFDGLEEACVTAREELDFLAAQGEEKGVSGELIVRLDDAGRILEAISRLDTANTSEDTVFRFFYCLGSFATDEELIRQAEAELP